jgi:hypothetical protein
MWLNLISTLFEEEAMLERYEQASNVELPRQI